MATTRLQDKVVLITGGGSGIGLASARLLLGEGAKVVIVGRNGRKLQQAAQSLDGADRLTWHAADAGESNQVLEVVDKVNATFGPVDILVNNAGANIKERTMRELNPERWRYLISANLDSAYNCIHAVLPHMVHRKAGMIVNISSISGKRASPLGGPAYAAAKFGMAALGISLAAEEKDSGIRVSNIYPGEVNTPILEHRPTAVTDAHRQTILKPEDVAAAVLFVVTLPPGVSVPELVITPSSQAYI
jgi:NADP-dependent 3-hydroxy acid dehydrogenase YdfG